VKIDKVILASNDNLDYLEFWPVVSQAWKKINIEPVLFYTGADKSIIKKGAGEVICCEDIGIDSAFHAQNIRLLAPALFPDDTCIISDIDNMPLNYNFFHGNVKPYSDDKFIIFRPDVCGNDQISIMWNVAKGEVWREIFNVKSWQEINTTLKSWFPNNYKVLGSGWFTDQIILRKYVDAWSKQDNVVKLHDMRTGFYRLDRLENSFNHTTNFAENMKNRYSDFHMPRPFKKHQEYIHQIFNAMVMSDNDKQK
jgi:hypothetical protein